MTTSHWPFQLDSIDYVPHRSSIDWKKRTSYIETAYQHTIVCIATDFIGSVLAIYLELFSLTQHVHVLWTLGIFDLGFNIP